MFAVMCLLVLSSSTVLSVRLWEEPPTVLSPRPSFYSTMDKRSASIFKMSLTVYPLPPSLFSLSLLSPCFSLFPPPLLLVPAAAEFRSVLPHLPPATGSRESSECRSRSIHGQHHSIYYRPAVPLHICQTCEPFGGVIRGALLCYPL